MTEADRMGGTLDYPRGRQPVVVESLVYDKKGVCLRISHSDVKNIDIYR